MGRLSRHRKIKSCDPFYKGHREVDISSNAPVNPSELDSQPIPRKAKHLFKSNRKPVKTGKNVRIEKEKDRKKSKAKLNLIRREDETWKEFYQRLDKQAAEQVARILVKETHANQKRKEFFKARKERSSKKRRNVGQEEYMDFTTDNVKFGEVVNEPPNLTSKPRHADSKTDTKSKRKVDSLLLKSKLETSNQGQEHENGPQSLAKSKKRKHMSAFERQVSDKRRQEAIAAYRKLKEKKAVKPKT